MATKFSPDYLHFDPLSAVRQSLGAVARTYGRRRTISQNFEVTVAEFAAGELVVLIPIQSSSVLHELKISNDDLDTGTVTLTVDVGLCDKDGADINTGAGDSRDMFGADSTAFDTAVVPSAPTDFAFSVQDDPAVPGLRMWERVNFQTAGVFTEDPNRLWFICLRVVIVAATPVAGTIGFQISYTLD